MKTPRSPRLQLLQPDVVKGLIANLRLTRLLKRLPERPVWALFMFINGFIAIAIMSGIAMLSGTPFIFPSLGPTAVLLFYSPLTPPASPRHSVLGHAIGIVCGYGSLWVVSMQHAPAITAEGVHLHRILAAALSLGLTGALMILLKAAHPPAAATTLIISLGIVTKPFDLVIIEVAVVLLVLQGFIINRLAGLNYPIWALREKTPAQAESGSEPA
ncbi:MAG: HPP family protein [Acidobacteriota bacterium]|nr:HPP family protein [Acidobacteriota bacterium]